MLSPKSLLTNVVRPTLNFLNLGGVTAEMLVMGTGLTESGLATLSQSVGPARGLFQMEPATEADLWASFISRHTDLAAKVQQIIGVYPMRPDALFGNLYYQAAMCRIKYYSINAPLPSNSINDLAAYWKQWYNTRLGAGSPQEFVMRSMPMINLWSNSQ